MAAFMTLLARSKLVWGTLPAAIVVTATLAGPPAGRDTAIPVHVAQTDRPTSFAPSNDVRPHREDAGATRRYRTFFGYLEFDWDGDIPGFAPRLD